MHDKNGTPLKEGDIVLIPAKITKLYSDDEYCNVDLETTHGRRPDGDKEHINAINTGVLVLSERPDVQKGNYHAGISGGIQGCQENTNSEETAQAGQAAEAA